jgi:hypothetical protein
VRRRKRVAEFGSLSRILYQSFKTLIIALTLTNKPLIAIKPMTITVCISKKYRSTVVADYHTFFK